MSGAHTYVDDGTYTVTVTVADDDGGSATIDLTFAVANQAPVVDAFSDLNGVEGMSLEFFTTFTDAGIFDTHTAVISWSDGSTSNGFVSEANGQGMVGATHIYADNGVYPLTVTVTDNAGDQGTSTATATVANAAPVVTAAEDQSIDEDQLLEITIATFTDRGFDSASTTETFTAQVDWGDGTPIEDAFVIWTSGSPGVLTVGEVSAGHSFVDPGVYNVEVTVSDDDNGMQSESFVVDVLNVIPTLDPIDEIYPVEGERVDLVATFSDPGDTRTHTATIDWGDGTIDEAVVNFADGAGTLSASHYYADNGSYQAEVTVIDELGASDSVQFTATVANENPVLFVPSDHQVRAGVSETIVVGQFRDAGFTSTSAGTFETFTATIDWGDGSPTEAGLVDVIDGTTGTPTVGAVSGTHTYADLGTYTITVTVEDDDQGIATSSFVVTSIAKFYVVDQSAHTTFRYGGSMGLLSQSSVDPNNSSLRGATTDPLGTTLWVVDASKDIFVYDRQGNVQGSWKAQDLTNPGGIASDGMDIFVVNVAKDQIHRYAGGVAHLSGQHAAAEFVRVGC